LLPIRLQPRFSRVSAEFQPSFSRASASSLTCPAVSALSALSRFAAFQAAESALGHISMAATANLVYIAILRTSHAA
jgi:hypothetical protein